MDSNTINNTSDNFEVKRINKTKKIVAISFIVVMGIAIIISVVGMIMLSKRPIIMQGQIEATEIRISGKLMGRVDTFLVKEGDYVHAGDTLVVLNSPEALAKLQEVSALGDVAKYQQSKIDDGTRKQIIATAEQVWIKTKSDLKLAKTTYDRIEALYKDDVVTSQRRDEVKAIYDGAQAAERAAWQQYQLALTGAQKQDKESAGAMVSAAQGIINQVNALLVDARLVAPESGQIGSIFPKRGELVGAGMPIMSLIVLSDAHIVMNVREDRMPHFQMGGTFKGDVPALQKKDITFKIYYISPLGSFATWKSTKQTGSYDMKTFEIHALPTEPVDGLRPGMSVLVNLESAGKVDKQYK